MNSIPLGKILEKNILPMFTGSTLGEELDTARRARSRVFRRGNDIVVRAAEGSPKIFVLRRSQPFEPADAEFIECFVERLHEIGDRLDEKYYQDLINPLLRRSVADRVQPRSPHYETTPQGERVSRRLPDVSGLVAEIIERFEGWAEETYEGRRIAAAIGVDASDSTVTGVQLSKVLDEKFGVVLANGLETFLRVGATGQVAGHEPLNSGVTSTHAPDTQLFAPLRFRSLAGWAKGPRVGVGLTRNGEILVFAGQKLVFAKRRGVWHHFTHEALLKRMALRGAFWPDICRAVFQTCLDTSFARTGGGIALVRRTEFEALQAAGIVSDEDRVGATGTKGQCLKTIVKGELFQHLDRHLRHDLAAIDGATILDFKGNVLAVGAIVQLAGAGSVGGGARTAAARTLAKYGLAIKISSDGAITGFKLGATGIEKVFEVG